MSQHHIIGSAAWSGADGAEDQFRLTRVQSYNWGTFDGLVDIAVPKAGFLFVGPSGSGKSTLLDAHAALLTPPRWVDFNVAARETERRGQDRNLMTYVRGAWSQQTSEGGDYLAQYLRLGTTWSAIAETYENERGQVVVLAQVFWVRGASTTAADVRKLYLVLQRELGLRDLQFFAESDFDVRRFKNALPDAFVRDEFSPYQERFRALLGIDHELALRLLHKTQSAKNLGDINVFLRDFMLDPPETFKVADRLVSEFGELNAAHQAVVAARRQIETLSPARVAHEELECKRREKSVLDELGIGVDPYREQRRRELLEARIRELGVEAEGMTAEALRLSEIVERERRHADELRLRRQGVGGSLIEQLQAQLEKAESERPRRVQRRERAASACRTLGWDLPDSAPRFVERVAEAKTRLLASREVAGELERRKDALKEQKRRKEAEFADARAEIGAMERQRSNIPARMLEVRARMAETLGVSEEVLPFAGELLQVKMDAAAWQGALERVLHGLAQSLIVDDRYYPAVASYLNDTNVGTRLVYLRTLAHNEPRRQPNPNSLIRKLDIAPGQHADWLRTELLSRFDYECAESLTAFRNATRALTREGQVKHNSIRHEKDDRQPVDDRSRWVLGFDNKEKLALYKEQAADIAAELAQLGARLEELDAEGGRQTEQLLQCQTLANLSWDEIDVAALLGQIQSFQESIARETRARPELAQLDREIQAQTRVLQAAIAEHDEAELRRRNAANARTKQQRALAELAQERLSITLTSTQLSG
ncbi:MAG TPA: ATP-binding protein, partial [Polyangiaceae bacterium]|nr:ATP-binding protein [Polyangiaceae bacterium]